MKLLLILPLIAFSVHTKPEPYEIIPQGELDALNVYPTTDSAVGYALMMYEGQE